MAKNVTVNPWANPPAPDEMSVLLHATDWDPTAPYKNPSMVGPPTQQQMEEEAWKQQVLKQLLLEDLQNGR